jgi:hypothetical protein
MESFRVRAGCHDTSKIRQIFAILPINEEQRMSADLAIHIRTEAVTLEVLKAFFSNSLGSPYFNPVSMGMMMQSGAHDRAFDIIADTPSVNVGEVSWLKALVFDDPDAFIPDPVQQVKDLIDSSGNTVITDELIDQVQAAMQAPNDTGYDVSDSNKIVEFLKTHKGARAFTVSW